GGLDPSRLDVGAPVTQVRQETSVVVLAVVEHLPLPRHTQVVADLPGDPLGLGRQLLVPERQPAEGLARLLQRLEVLDRVRLQRLAARGVALTVLQRGDHALRVAQQDEELRLRPGVLEPLPDRKSTRLNSSHVKISYA